MILLFQGMLMLGTLLGPGTIFLMIVGSTSAAFHISNTSSFIYNLIPVIIFMVLCLTTKSQFQVSASNGSYSLKKKKGKKELMLIEAIVMGR